MQTMSQSPPLIHLHLTRAAPQTKTTVDNVGSNHHLASFNGTWRRDNQVSNSLDCQSPVSGERGPGRKLSLPYEAFFCWEALPATLLIDGGSLSRNVSGEEGVLHWWAVRQGHTQQLEHWARGFCLFAKHVVLIYSRGMLCFSRVHS